jgi:hypothetical protein
MYKTETVLAEFVTMLRHRKDAEHFTQAISKGCEFFLADDGELLNKAERLHQKYGIQVLTPSELAKRGKRLPLSLIVVTFFAFATGCFWRLFQKYAIKRT